MDAAIDGENRMGLVNRKPLGVVGAITPFNFPLNLSLHKIAPAIAAGNTIVFKPGQKTPISAYKLVKLFEEAGLPNGALNLLNFRINKNLVYSIGCMPVAIEVWSLTRNIGMKKHPNVWYS
jgi:acyl-CoA reductase-like NAD-dependent aldehyde dehydrogenase